MDNGLEMGRQGSYLVSGGGTSSRRRKLLQVQREHPLQLPEIIDLLPTVPKDKQFPGCCKGGLLASQAQDPNTMATSFQMSVGHLRTLNITMKLPMEFHLLRPGQGYTYNASKIGPSSVFFLPDGQRRTSVMGEWTSHFEHAFHQPIQTWTAHLIQFLNVPSNTVFVIEVTWSVTCTCNCSLRGNRDVVFPYIFVQLEDYFLPILCLWLQRRQQQHQVSHIQEKNIRKEGKTQFLGVSESQTWNTGLTVRSQAWSAHSLLETVQRSIVHNISAQYESTGILRLILRSTGR